MDILSLINQGPLGYIFIIIAILTPVPEETIVIGVAYLAHINLLNKFLALIVLLIASLIEDNLSYWLGRNYGSQFLIKKMKEKPFLNRNIHKIEKFIHSHGGKTIFLARFLYGFRYYTPMIAGTSKMKYGKFLLFNSLAILIWVPSLYIISLFFSENLVFILRGLGLLRNVSNLLLGIVIALILFLIVKAEIRYWKNKKA